jgi:hypothetical protein
MSDQAKLSAAELQEIRERYEQPIHVTVGIMLSDIPRILAHIEQITAERDVLIHRKANDGLYGHGEKCNLCAESCDSLAGNPSRWPTFLPFHGGNGKLGAYHIGCVSTAIASLTQHQKALRLAAYAWVNRHAQPFTEADIQIVVAGWLSAVKAQEEK